jgi:4'-phosphopantetheinyl transferase
VSLAAAQVERGAALFVLRMDRAFSSETLGRLSARLPEPERQRIMRFRRPVDAQRSLLAHLLVRELLAGTGGAPPLRRDGYGRPRLDRPVNGIRDLNVSHSGPWVALACCSAGRVGVDVEVERDVGPELAEMVFTPDEQAGLGAPVRGFREGFFRQWTLKESFVKAVGCGLSLPLLAFSVEGDEEIRLRWTRGGSARSRWRFVHSNALGPDCHLAVCTEGCEPPRYAQPLRLLVDGEGPVFVSEPATLDLAAAQPTS